MAVHTLFLKAHIVSRIFVGITFLFTAVLNSVVAIALIQLMLFILILVNLERGYTTIQRSMKLLRWLIIPIVLLHAFFTPGELIVSGMTIPVSFEGLQNGFWFALHLTVIFFSAMVFSRLLTNSEWIRSTLKLPVIGLKILPYAILMEAARGRIKAMLEDEYSSWRSDWHGNEKSMKNFVKHLAMLPVKALKQSDIHANEVWSNWDHHVSRTLTDKSSRKVSVVATITALAVASLLWYAYLLGGAD